MDGVGFHWNDPFPPPIREEIEAVEEKERKKKKTLHGRSCANKEKDMLFVKKKKKTLYTLIVIVYIYIYMSERGKRRKYKRKKKKNPRDPVSFVVFKSSAFAAPRWLQTGRRE